MPHYPIKKENGPTISDATNESILSKITMQNWNNWTVSEQSLTYKLITSDNNSPALEQSEQSLPFPARPIDLSGDKADGIFSYNSCHCQAQLYATPQSPPPPLTNPSYMCCLLVCGVGVETNHY